MILYKKQYNACIKKNYDMKYHKSEAISQKKEAYRYLFASKLLGFDKAETAR